MRGLGVPAYSRKTRTVADMDAFECKSLYGLVEAYMHGISVAIDVSGGLIADGRMYDSSGWVRCDESIQVDRARGVIRGVHVIELHDSQGILADVAVAWHSVDPPEEDGKEDAFLHFGGDLNIVRHPDIQVILHQKINLQTSHRIQEKADPDIRPERMLLQAIKLLEGKTGRDFVDPDEVPFYQQPINSPLGKRSSASSQVHTASNTPPGLLSAPASQPLAALQPPAAPVQPEKGFAASSSSTDLFGKESRNETMITSFDDFEKMILEGKPQPSSKHKKQPAKAPKVRRRTRGKASNSRTVVMVEIDEKSVNKRPDKDAIYSAFITDKIIYSRQTNAGDAKKTSSSQTGMNSRGSTIMNAISAENLSPSAKKPAPLSIDLSSEEVVAQPACAPAVAVPPTSEEVCHAYLTREELQVCRFRPPQWSPVPQS